MSDMRDLKCQCCKCYDSFDGCTAFDCQYDFEISIAKVKEVSRESGMSVDTIVALIQVEENKHKVNDVYDCLPDDFDPYRDTQFLINFTGSPDVGKKLLIEMAPEDLQRLRAEIDAVLKIQEGK